MGFGRSRVADRRRQREEDRIVRHTDPPATVKAARTRLEKSMPRWLRHHGGEAFVSPWSADHLRVLGKIERAINEGGLFALAMPRGHGKSTICKWTVLYVLLTGKRHYVVSVAATAEYAEAIVDFCRRQLVESETLHAHYPHVTTYARATEDKAIKARHQLRADGKSSGIHWRKTTLVLPEVLSSDNEPYPSNGGVVEGHGLTGAIKGRWRDTKTGRVLRPDFVILDDPQTRESGESESQCDMRERIITGDVLGLAGPRKRIAAVMPCTIIRRGDLADRFLDHAQHPEWQGETCRLVDKWPDAQDTLWRQYADLYRENVGDGAGQTAATAFYLAHRAEMDAGAKVAWSSRVRDGEVSALQTAENLLLETGPQFWAEYQNDPQTTIGSQYELSPALVCSRVNGFPRLTVPEGVEWITAAADVNYSGLNWVVLAATSAGVIYCPAYGCYTGGRPALFDPKTQPKQLEAAAIAHGCVAWMREIERLTVMVGDTARHVNIAGIDCGSGWSDTVVQAVYSLRLPVQCVPVRGSPALKYRPQKDAVRVGEGWYIAKWRLGRVLVLNSDLYRETAQRAFLAEPGTPGSISLWTPDHRSQHMTFAEEICGERLVEHAVTPTSDFYRWDHRPGQRWDKLDALAYARALVAWCGLSESGTRMERPADAARGQRRIRHIEV